VNSADASASTPSEVDGSSEKKKSVTPKAATPKAKPRPRVEVNPLLELALSFFAPSFVLMV
jgi:hypothetical protein